MQSTHLAEELSEVLVRCVRGGDVFVYEVLRVVGLLDRADLRHAVQALSHQVENVRDPCLGFRV